METRNNYLSKIKELTEKAASCRVSLGRIEKVLCNDPLNEDMITLRKDLIEIVDAAQNELTEYHDKMCEQIISSGGTDTEPAPAQFKEERPESDYCEDEEMYFENTSGGPFICSYCTFTTPLSFKTEDHLSHHIRNAHPYAISKPEDLALPVKTEKSESGTVLQGPSFSSSSFATDDDSAEDEKEFEEAKPTMTKSGLRKLRQEKRKERKVAEAMAKGTICPLCFDKRKKMPRMFSTKENLEQHLAQRHPNGYFL